MKYGSFRALLEDMPSDRRALLWDGGELTCGALRERVFALAERYRGEGWGCIGLLAPASPEWVVQLFASVLAGKRTVLLDAGQPEGVVQTMVRATGVDALWCPDEALSAALTLCPPAPAAAGGEGSILFFTSGTTEHSRAVVLSSRALCFSAWNGQQMLPCGQGDTVLAMLPMTHVFGFVCTLLWPLCYGAAVALGRGMRSMSADPKFFRPTILIAVPTLLRFLLAVGALNEELRCVLVGASPCDAETLSAVAARGIELRFGYGLTETASGVAISTGGDPFSMALCPDTELTIADDGEVLLRTSCMMEGYWNDPAATAAVLRDGVLHTGDLGHLDGEGNLRITGRKKDVLVLPNGNKVFCPQWERELCALLGTGELAVALRDGRLVLVLAGSDADDGALWEKLNTFNASRAFDMHITGLERREAPLPRTATGKIKRWML